jgi:hypothetical protein
MGSHRIICVPCVHPNCSFVIDFDKSSFIINRLYVLAGLGESWVKLLQSITLHDRKNAYGHCHECFIFVLLLDSCKRLTQEHS